MRPLNTCYLWTQVINRTMNCRVLLAILCLITAKSAAQVTTSSTSSAPMTAASTLSTTSEPEIATAVFDLTFSIKETFDPALAISNSPKFLEKAKNIRSQVEPLYSKSFKNFMRMEIVQFRSGFVVDSSVYFSSSGPNVTASDVKKTLLNGLSSLDFPVISASISAIQVLGSGSAGNSMPPVIASSLSLIWMSLLSLLLSLALHF
ncbi:uncharacterized protein LOC128508357 [Clarias gariepinus]|uniref:uncharacterized protein LOC128508357 n=1 Tax=Clarias gariepinus TaxID=13013 RepID=UPI00234D25BB|nr:uncharacterized protein LOC128508357 [Clarias gariepinus]